MRPDIYLWLFFFLTVFFQFSGLAQSNDYKLVRTPQNIAANRTLPGGILPSGEAIPANFSTDPTDQEIFRIHFFEEPMVPANISATTGENLALVYALAGFSTRKGPDDFSALLNFLKSYPKSRWRGALLTNLGICYRRSGYYNQAVKAWQSAWDLLKDQKEARVKVLADRVVSELLLINAWVGRVEKIDSLLKQIDQRIMEGPASERVVSIRASLWQMKNNPGISFKCGPYALDKLFILQDSSHTFNEQLTNVQSTSRGFSLTELDKMAESIGLHYQMAFREAGAPVIVNAVIHWKLDHYSALLKADSGFYKCEDATMGTAYGQQFWLTSTALDSSASGYFLVPAGPLPNGWRSVSESEGSGIFGKGQEPRDKGKHLSAQDQTAGCNGQPGSPTPPMAQCNVHADAVSLHVFDRPLYYTPPKGPVMFWNVDYHHRDSYQPANFSYSNMGPKWTCQWLSYVQDNPGNPAANADVYLMGGGDRTFTSYNATTKSYAPELQTNDVLVRICANCYELRHPDGSKEVYARPDGNTSAGRKIFLTQKVDAAGNAITVSYDANLRIVALQDTIGQVTNIFYENTSDIYKITKVTDPFGRSASFQYDNKGRLIQITDMIGIVSSFQYDAVDFINQMTTPYGVTTFVKEDGPGNYASVETHYPLGEKERVEFKEIAPGINVSEAIHPSTAVMSLFNTYMYYRNTFYWDKKAMQDAPGIYTKAKIYHWLHGSGATGESGSIAPILESVKDPLENRVWYQYQGQSSAGFANQGMSAHPSIVGRVLDDSTSQFTRYTYNILGAVTSATDPLGRKFTYTYDSSNINLLEVRQNTGTANELLEQYTYNSQHLPLMVKDASGQITTYTYNAAGQVLTIQNPKKETTTFGYDTNGYLLGITGPVAGTTVSFTYDGFGRIHTMTSPEGYIITTDYDVLDRPTVITYPDSTYEQLVYDRLDAVRRRDRLGRWSVSSYDSLDRPTQLQDALGRVTQYIWCNCGSLSQIIDPLKQITTFTQDLQGRIITKAYNDGKSIAYKYENTTSRLKEVTDAKGQKTQYHYFIDDNLKQVVYANAAIATPSVAYTYESQYNRIASMTDLTGTTLYSYNPVLAQPMLGAGRLASIDGPLPNDLIEYTYDSLNRVAGRSINGVASSIGFDVLGRVMNATNVLGSFRYNYLNQTSRLSSISLPNGSNTTFDYFDNMGDQRLKQIRNTTASGSLLSEFDYEYNPEGQLNQWIQWGGNTRPKAYELKYDAADQLVAVSQNIQKPAVTINSFSYKYDPAGNRIVEQTMNSSVVSTYNSLNQLIGQQDIDSLRAKGNIPPGLVNYPNLNNNLVYDDNGNMVSATSPATAYAWDGQDRLIKITQGANSTEFVYDGLGRRVAEKLNGAFIRRWLWDGTELCEERDAGGTTVTKRFFPQGEQINGINYYFTMDHLGSIREMTDSSGAVQARYDYDPYGRRTKTSGDLDADFGFTGHYYHASSGLNLTLYRLYDANMGRWLSRDPIAEQDGLNLYGYVKGNPGNFIDPLGLAGQCVQRNSCASTDEKGSFLIYSATYVNSSRTSGYLTWYNSNGEEIESFPAVSGSGKPKYYTIPSGEWQATSINTVKSKKFTRKGVSYRITLGPDKYDPNRGAMTSYIRIHPARKNGTEGCIGLTSNDPANLKDLGAMMQEYISIYGPIPVSVIYNK